MRLIDADALKALPFNRLIHTDFGDTCVSFEEIDAAPTVEPRQYILKVKPQTDIEKFKAVFSNYITPQEIEIVPLTPEGNFTIDELRDWLHEIFLNNIDNSLGGACLDIRKRLDGFERFCKDRRGGDAHE